MSTDVPFFRLATEFPDAIPWLLGFPAPAPYQVHSMVLKKEHRLDAVFIPEDPQTPRLLVEFQGFRDEDILRRVAASAALYCEKERYSGVLHLAVLFTEAAFSRDLKASCLRLANDHVVELRPQLVVLGPEVAKQIFADGRPELLPLLPLCVRSKSRIRSEAADWRERIEATPLPEAQKRSLIGLLGAFVLHRLGEMNVETLNRLLGGFMMEDTQVGRELMEKGRLKGYDQGREEGWEKGREKGREEGLEKGREAGLQVARTAILQVITRRFKKSTREVTHLVQRLDSLETVTVGLTLALEAEQLQDLEEALRGLVDE